MIFVLKIFLVKQKYINTQYHYVLVLFVVGLLNEVDMLEVHDLLVKDLNLAQISRIPRL